MTLKLGRKLPYGPAVIMAAILAALIFLSLSPATNTNGGYEFLNSPGGKFFAISGACIFTLLALIFIINSFFVENELEKAERERAAKAKIYKDVNNNRV